MLSLIRFSYLAFTIYGLILIFITSFKATDILLAIVLIWLVFLSFFLGNKLQSNSLKKKVRNEKIPIVIRNKKLLLYLSIISIICSLFATRFYTGQTPLTITQTLLNLNSSIYNQYQLHVINQNIGEFTLTKIPYVLMLFYIKFFLFYSVNTLFKYQSYISNIDYLSLLLFISAHVYFGIARGTNFEFFEIVILIIYTIIINQTLSKKKSFKAIFILLITVYIMIVIYYYRISDRGVTFDAYQNIHFTVDRNNWFVSIFPFLSSIVVILYDYFGFGLYYISTFISEILTNDVFSLINYIFIPFTSNGHPSIQESIGSFIVVGTRWHPDIILFFETIGILFTYLFIFFIGVFWSYIAKNYNNHMVRFTGFLIFFQMISFPIGNFVAVSSASRLTILSVGIYWFWKIVVNKKVVL